MDDQYWSEVLDEIDMLTNMEEIFPIWKKFFMSWELSPNEIVKGDFNEVITTSEVIKIYHYSKNSQVVYPYIVIH